MLPSRAMVICGSHGYANSFENKNKKDILKGIKYWKTAL